MTLSYANSTGPAKCPTTPTLPSSQTITPSVSTSNITFSTTLSGTTPTCSGYTFLGYATSSSSTTASYAKSGSYNSITKSYQSSDQAVYPSSSYLTMYAIWTPNYTLSYDANGGSGAPESQTAAPSVSSMKPTTASFTIPSTTPTRSGYTFLGWATNTSEADTSKYYQAGSTYTASSTPSTLYAMWGQDYAITYNANGGTGAPAMQTGNAANVIISATEPTLTNKYFHGWASTNNATEVEYKAGKAYPAADFAPSKTLYAVWKDEPATLYMQNVDSWGSRLAIGDSIQAIDSRDNKTYWVTRLCTDANYKTSGTCGSSEIWMTQNLDYDIKADGTDEIATIGSATTSTWSTSATYPPHATTTILYCDSDYSYTGTCSLDPGDYYVENGGGSSNCTTWRPSSDCGSTKATVSLTSADAKGNTNLHYHLGNYYQWNAATAGTGGTITSQDATSSICPKGWRLPTSNSYTDNYSFGKLTNAYGITNSTTGSSDVSLLSSPLWFVRAGSVRSSLGGQGTSGSIWSSRAYPSRTDLAHGLYFASTRVDPLGSNGRESKEVVRCVAE